MENEIHNTGDELTHWGIKGMRWGIRRYQNKDGSLTPAGKKKLRAEQAKVREQEAINKKRKSVQASFDRLEARKKAAADEKKALDEAERVKLGKGKRGSGKKNDDADAQPAKKSYKDMTDAELNAAINRARMEETYRQLHPEPVAKPSFMNKVFNEAVVPAAINAGKKFLENALGKAGENLLKDKVDPNSLEALNKIRDKAKAKYEALDYENKSKKIKEGKIDDDNVNWDNKKKQLEYENAVKDQEYKNLQREYNVKTKRDQLAKLNSQSDDNSGGNSGGNSSSTSNTTASQPVSSVSDKTLHLGKTTVARYTITGGSRAGKQSKTEKSADNYPNEDEWQDFQSQYSWGVDKPVTNLSNRTISLGRTTAERYTQTKKDDD